MEAKDLWEPITLEDELLYRYLMDNPGELYLEFPVGLASGRTSARRIDGILLPCQKSKIYESGSYEIEELKNKLQDKTIHIIEAKQELNRGVIGQVFAGAKLFKKEYNPREAVMSIVCSRVNEDLTWVCEKSNISVQSYSFEKSADNSTESTKRKSTKSIKFISRKDIRREPDLERKRAFFAGWTSAVKC